MGSYYLMVRVLVWNDEKILEVDDGVSCINIVNILNTTELCT